MTNVLLLGSGSREHAMGASLKVSPDVRLCVCGSHKNPGLVALADEYCVGDPSNVPFVLSLAESSNAELVVIGPEAPLAQGLADACASRGIGVVGPVQAAARLETSKSFTRQLLAEEGIELSPAFKVVHYENELSSWLESWEGPFVVKPDGLTGGKGVRVQGDHFVDRKDGILYALECLHNDGTVVLEEKLVGQEFSLMSFCDGTSLSHMPVIQDHKRLLSGDRGPNTGGMGTISDVDHRMPFLQEQDIERAQAMNIRVIEALARRGISYRGVLYGNYIAVAQGIKLIEYNARFGDPEAMNVFSLLETPFLDICQAIAWGTLSHLAIHFAHKASVCKYAVPEGYPDRPIRDKEIDSSKVDHSNVRVFYGAVEQRGDSVVLTGSRAIALVGVGDSIEQAQQLVEAEMVKIKGPVIHRADIGTNELLQSRVSMMNDLRKPLLNHNNL